MGVDIKYNAPVENIDDLLAKYDAVFVGSGAPAGRDLQIPGRQQVSEQVKIGIAWLADIAFEHIDHVESNVLVIGGGNTAMDCCRTAKRIGGERVTVVAPESFGEMLASPWEKEETIEEQIPIVNHLLPKEFMLENGRLIGVKFQHLTSCYDAQGRFSPQPSGDADQVLPCDVVILAIGQNNAFPFIKPESGIELNDRGLAIVNETTFQSTNPKVFFGGDAAFGPKNIIWAVAHGHEAAISMHQYLYDDLVTKRPPIGMNLVSQKMGIHEWSYSNPFSEDDRVDVPHETLKKRMADLKVEVELGYNPILALKEAERCLNCDVQTVFEEPRCIECDACIDICPVSCLTITENAHGEELLTHLTAPPLRYPDQALLVSDPLVQTQRVMVKDEDLCVHCGLCAERCPTGAWDMQKFTLQLPKAGEQAGGY